MAQSAPTHNAPASASTLSIHRWFNPGATPTRGTRVYRDRWYLVTMQNVGRDQGDGLWLAEGEYTDLVPGSEARNRRDSRLNHCNRIAEYRGPVYQVVIGRYWHMEQGHGFCMTLYSTGPTHTADLIRKHRTDPQRHNRAEWARQLATDEARTWQTLRDHSLRCGIGSACTLEYWRDIAYPEHVAHLAESKAAYAADLARGDWPVTMTRIR